MRPTKSLANPLFETDDQFYRLKIETQLLDSHMFISFKMLMSITRKREGTEETFVSWFRPAFDTEYAKAPGKMPRSRPAMEEMLMIEPSLFAAIIRFPTAFDISHAPRRLVFMIVFHSSSSCVKGVFTGPTHIQKENKG
jgi:hypothetical protein